MDNEYNVTGDTFSKIKESINNSDNKLIQLAGIRVLDLSKRHVKLEMPLGDVHVNHIGTAYAISMLMLMEIGGASLIRATYGFDTYIPVIKKLDVVYLKPTSKTLICNLFISEKDAEEKIIPVAQRGRGDFILPITLTDIENEEIAKSNINYYLISNK